MPNRKYHFISGMPRSGSTLLAAILRQNSRIHTGMTSGLERQVRHDLFHFNRMFSPKAQDTVYSGAERLMAHEALVGAGSDSWQSQ